MKHIYLLTLLLFAACTVDAQNNTFCKVNAVLVVGTEQSPVSGAYIQSLGAGDATFSDDKGHFTINVKCTGADTIAIRSIGRIDYFTINDGHYSDDTFHLAVKLLELSTATVTYLDGQKIVEEAVKHIPDNYPTTSYAAFGYYRNYKNINQRFREVTEMKLGTAMRITNDKNELVADEAFAIDKLRRTLYTISIDEFYDGELDDLMRQNLIYHREYAPFSQLFIDHGTFTIDSAGTTDSTWLINYEMRGITGENHGVTNYSPQDFIGEAQETGYFIINKSDYAFLKIVRESVRNNKYHYTKYNNFLQPDLRYTEQFFEGFLECNYTEHEGDYYATSMFHAYRNNFSYVPTNTDVYFITDYSEWHCDSISGIIDSAWLSKFSSYSKILDVEYDYHPEDWVDTPSWYFVRKEQVFDDLKLVDDPDKLFTLGGE